MNTLRNDESNAPTVVPEGSGAARRLRHDECGQATAEYALVIVAAAAIALALIVWATSTGTLSSLFDAVLAKVASYV